jgi:hypothetical protein
MRDVRGSRTMTVGFCVPVDGKFVESYSVVDKGAIGCVEVTEISV